MSRTSKEYREVIQDVLDSGMLRRLWFYMPFRDAKDLDEAKRIAEDIVKMSDEELDRLRESLTPPQDPQDPD